MLAARVGVLVVTGAVVVSCFASCVNLKYPAGASRDGGGPPVAQLGTGRACAAAGQCQSGICADGFCCTKACDSVCFTCAKPGNEGSCMPADVGTNPRAQCPDEGRSSCGHDGLCDGAGNCQTYSPGTVCQDASCVRDLVVLASRCSADGVCVPGDQKSCEPFLCDTGAKCLTTCTEDKFCVNGHKCDATGSCGLKALGTSCQLGDECEKGICAQGVCCAVACAGGCLSCAVPGSEGACVPVPAGMPASDPTFCKASAASTCGLDGSCDGSGACRNFVSGTICAPASCSSSTLQAAGTCDGKTHCQVPAVATCGGYTCGSATACRTTCASDTDCANPSVCSTVQGACGGLSAQYFRQINLTDLAFTRTDPAIDFNWMGSSPNTMLLNVDNFSIRWRGKLTARFDGLYTFYAATDDGERLIVGGKTLIDHFIRHSTVPEDTATFVMKAGQPVDIVFEYFESGGDASALLSWSSDKELKAVIPTSALSPQ